MTPPRGAWFCRGSVWACMGGVLLAGCIMGVLSVLGVSAFGTIG